MNCQYCEQPFEHDDRVIIFEEKVFHECECFIDYMIENVADEPPLTYLKYLEKRIMEG